MKHALRGCSRLGGVVTLLALIVQFSGCTTSTDSDERKLTRGINGDPESLDPHKYTSTQAAEVLRDLGEGLFAYDSKGRLVSGVAKSWQLSSDGQRYVFQIDQNKYWSDGTRVTAHDFIAGFQRLVDPQTASPSAMRFSAVEKAPQIIAGVEPPSELGVRAIDDSELEIWLSAPNPNFLSVLAHPSTFPVCTECQNLGWQFASDEKGRNAWISNGPYVLSRWDRTSLLELQKNTHFPEHEKIHFDQVRYIVADPSVEVDRFRAGELDITSNVDAAKFNLVRQNYADELHVSPTLGLYYYGFNLKKSPFAEQLLIRRALSLAIDRDQIVKYVTGRGEVPAYSIVPDIVRNYESSRMEGWNLPATERVELARMLYEQAGYSLDSPMRVELRFNVLGGNRNIAVAVQAMWHEVLGVETTLIAEDFRVLLSNIRSAEETQVFRLSWVGDNDDPETFLRLFESGNPNNLTGYSNEGVDQLFGEAQVTVDEKRRLEIFEKAEQIVVNDHAIIPLYFFVSKHLVRRNIVGWESNSLDVHPSKFLARE